MCHESDLSNYVQHLSEVELLDPRLVSPQPVFCYIISIAKLLKGKQPEVPHSVL